MARRARPLRASVAALPFLLALVTACAPVEPASPAPPPAQPAAFPSDVDQLRGFPAADVAGRLGKPDFVREEPPAVIWQYRSSDCVLDLFLYRDSDELRVAYAEAHDREFVVRVSQSDCYAGLVARRARPL